MVVLTKVTVVEMVIKLWWVVFEYNLKIKRRRIFWWIVVRVKEVESRKSTSFLNYKGGGTDGEQE